MGYQSITKALLNSLMFMCSLKNFFSFLKKILSLQFPKQSYFVTNLTFLLAHIPFSCEALLFGSFTRQQDKSWSISPTLAHGLDIHSKTYQCKLRIFVVFFGLVFFFFVCLFVFFFVAFWGVVCVCCCFFFFVFFCFSNFLKPIIERFFFPTDNNRYKCYLYNEHNYV